MSFIEKHKMFFKSVFLILLYSYLVFGQDPTTTILPTTTTLIPPTEHDVNGNSFKWSPTDDPSIVVTVDPGYHISATISGLDLNGDEQDYVVIKGGQTLEDDSTSGRIFTYNVNKELKYLFSTEKVFGYYKDIAGDFDGKFTVVFERRGDVTTTTTTISTTTVDWPTTEAGDSVYLTVNVTSPGPFTDPAVNLAFRSCVAEMTKAYCKEQSIGLLEPITETNIVISDATRCPYAWPDSDDCVEIRFKIPIWHDNNLWNGYQLTTAHLEIMWERFAERFLTGGFGIYSEPNVDNIVMWWVIAIVVIVVSFLLILWILRVLSIKYSSVIRHRKLSDPSSIVTSKKDSNVSLTPHYLQDTPKLFDNEYPMIDPDLQ